MTAAKFGNRSKIEIAEIQICTAVEMLFESKDPVAVHTVAMAGSQIVRDLSRQKGDSAFLRKSSQKIVPGKEKEFWKEVNKAAGFFKHANRGEGEEFDGIYEEANDLAIFFACLFFQELTEEVPAPMLAFMKWIFCRRPDLLIICDERLHFESQDAFKAFRLEPRATQLKYGLIMLATAVEPTADIRELMESRRNWSVTI